MSPKLPLATILNQDKSKSQIKAHHVNSRMERQKKSRCFMQSKLSFLHTQTSIWKPALSLNFLLLTPLNVFIAEATWNWVFQLSVPKAYKLIQR